MAQVFVINKPNRSLIDFLEKNKKLLSDYGLRAAYSGEHIRVIDDDLILTQDEHALAAVQASWPYVIYFKDTGDPARTKKLLSDLKEVLSAFESETPVLIEVDY